jgi:erythromycin esterase-like protein
MRWLCRAHLAMLAVVTPFVLIAAFTPSAFASALAPVEPNDRPAMRAVMRDVCHRDVAVLGEATHADGHTEAFKVALVERLVTQCGFRAVVFEGSLYEFLGFNRARRDGRATETMVGNAIGGLWKFEAEIKPLTHFLYTEARAGRITLGGMDDQLGGFEQPFANETMVALLTQGLPVDRSAACVEAFHRRTYLAFDDDHPTSPDFKNRIDACALDMHRALSKQNLAERESAELIQMLDGIDRQLARDRLSSEEYAKDRDQAMYLAFKHFSASLPKRTRIIVWTHSFHAAKSPAIRPDLNGAPTFGTLLHQAYGSRAFALAFSARGGSYRWSRKENRPVPAPPPGALELAAPGDHQTAFLNSATLRARGIAPAAPDYHTYRAARWADIYDGLVVFAEEHPPHSSRVYPAP